MPRFPVLHICFLVVFLVGVISCQDSKVSGIIPYSAPSIDADSNVTSLENATSTDENTISTSVETLTVTVPVTTDVCGLTLVSLSVQAAARKCRCSDFNEEVDCSYLEITTLPKLISFPKSAREVTFIGNKIQNIAEDTFYGGKYVIEMDLSHNLIDFVSIKGFQAFKNLKRLDLSHNKLWNIPPKSFETLHSLKYLNLGYNDISTIFPELFADVPELIELDLQSNPLQELEPKLFEHLKKLEVLNLEATLLKIIPDHLFVFTPHLRLLDLSSNQLTYVPTDALKFLPHLSLLDLSGNPVSSIKEESFIGLRGLVLLYLDRMPLLTKIDKYAFGDLQNLQELHCSYNFLLEEVDEKAFVRKSDNKKVELAQLFLRQNSIGQLPQQLLNWNENVELHLSDNPIACDCNVEWMVHLSLKNEFQKHAKCFYPSHLQGVTLNQLKDSELSCGLELYEIVMIILSCVIFLLILALLIAFLVWRRHYAGYKRPYFRVSKKKNVDVEDGI